MRRLRQGCGSCKGGVCPGCVGRGDQMALETLASRHGRDLGAEGIVIVPIGGAHRALLSTWSGGWGFRFIAESDRDGAIGVLRVCGRLGGRTDPSLWSEEALLDSQGDFGSFQTLRKQPAWRQEGFEAQMRRWSGAGARRKPRYARLLVLSLHLDRMPRPLKAVLATTGTPTRQAG